MPTLRQRASSASAETRDLWSAITATVGPANSQLYTADLLPPLPYRGPVSAAVLNTANEKTPGGQWEGAVFAPEEALARRSNLVQSLTTSIDGADASRVHYPLPEKGGLFSPRVTVIRGGPEQNYALWDERAWRSVAVISVAPVRRPKLDESNTAYSFPQERELQREKMRTVLRMAAYQGITDICLSPFGSGCPVEEVCQIWKELLQGHGSEFEGWFRNVLFAVTNGKGEQNWEVFMRYFG
ncbi:hypothetical protein DRE_02866 [Drechslerella stenobrocha 248]|uniref:Microbial-type PARG catalytic domain-containing protein n=1 Tax=Drechslerella stenobrocha 248 TaxID=1043628 RepID=W7HWS7_9PEZI|nr:hypothetical protein DRE_02866 [Drechslerella stenobrocha 248]